MAATSLSLSAEPRVVERHVADRSTAEAEIRIVQVLEGVTHPWAMAWLPDGRMLVSERPGNLLLIDGDSVVALEGLPPIHAQEDQRTAPQGGSQGGLLDVVVHPDFASNGWIYFTYSSPGDPDNVTNDSRFGTSTALARARLNDEGTALIDLEALYAVQPRTNPRRHYGSRIAFPGDGTVLMTIGDRGLRYPSQDLTNPIGSVIRLNEDGGAAAGNPFIGVAPGNLRPEIFSFGHRNNQGLAINPATGDIWATDHGAAGGDLLYRIEAGANFGWPHVTFSTEYRTNEKIGIGHSAPGVTAPAHVWEESHGPSGLTFFNGDAFPAWQGQLFAGMLLAEEVHRIVLDGHEVVSIEPIISGEVGRIRDVRQGPDGNLWIATDQTDGGIFRIEPAN
ncbi:MAG: PQQ-dependent sugar dehydrogenase [Wenzhouxiangella sp.]